MKNTHFQSRKWPTTTLCGSRNFLFDVARARRVSLEPKRGPFLPKSAVPFNKKGEKDARVKSTRCPASLRRAELAVKRTRSRVKTSEPESLSRFQKKVSLTKVSRETPESCPRCCVCVKFARVPLCRISREQQQPKCVSRRIFPRVWDPSKLHPRASPLCPRLKVSPPLCCQGCFENLRSFQL